VCCRKLVFDEALARLKEKAAKEEKRRRRAREDFTALLKEEIKLDMPWEEAQNLLERFAEYKAVSPPRTHRRRERLWS
jgi:hypothetical protein